MLPPVEAVRSPHDTLKVPSRPFLPAQNIPSLCVAGITGASNAEEEEEETRRLQGPGRAAVSLHDSSPAPT